MPLPSTLLRRKGSSFLLSTKNTNQMLIKPKLTPSILQPGKKINDWPIYLLSSTLFPWLLLTFTPTKRKSTMKKPLMCSKIICKGKMKSINILFTTTSPVCIGKEMIPRKPSFTSRPFSKKNHFSKKQSLIIPFYCQWTTEQVRLCSIWSDTFWAHLWVAIPNPLYQTALRSRGCFSVWPFRQNRWHNVKW